MTPAKLIQWRKNLGWSQTDAVDALGISVRAYQYLEAGVTSRARPLKFIPKLTELVCAELTGPTGLCMGGGPARSWC
jgi:transcriptional regulator with XRE-family HTH domain